MEGSPYPVNRDNNFGFLRLLFATFVILSHSSLAIDGTRHREILSNIFGSLSFGELGLDCFFLVSGFLVISSYANSSSIPEFFWKRVLRIYPAFLVAYFVACLIVVPLAGGNLARISVDQWSILFKNAFILQPPQEFLGVFSRLKSTGLNGAMWTISYEFACYLLTPILFWIASINRWAFLLPIPALMAYGIFGNIYYFDNSMSFPIYTAFPPMVRFLSLFMCGAAFYIFRNRITYSNSLSFYCGVALLSLAFIPILAEVALSVFGAFIIFWFAFRVKMPFLEEINTRTDISYGTYLYASPVQSLIILYFPGVSPWTLFPATMIVAGTLGLLSWTFVERPCLALKSAVAGRAHPTDMA